LTTVVVHFVTITAIGALPVTRFNAATQERMGRRAPIGVVVENPRITIDVVQAHRRRATHGAQSVVEVFARAGHVFVVPAFQFQYWGAQSAVPATTRDIRRWSKGTVSAVTCVPVKMAGSILR